MGWVWFEGTLVELLGKGNRRERFGGFPFLETDPCQNLDNI